MVVLWNIKQIKGHIYITETVGCSDPAICMEVCGSPSGCSNVAYPQLVINLMPPGEFFIHLRYPLLTLRWITEGRPPYISSRSYI